jgi:hypothetical protein
MEQARERLLADGYEPGDLEITEIVTTRGHHLSGAAVSRQGKVFDVSGTFIDGVLERVTYTDPLGTDPFKGL